MPHLADLERRLTEKGKYEEFKEVFPAVKVGDIVKINQGVFAEIEGIVVGNDVTTKGTIKVIFKNGHVKWFNINDLTPTGKKVEWFLN